jgi:hypothetical protein
MNLKALAAAALGGLLLAANTEPRLPSGWSRQSSFGADRACTAGLTFGLAERARRALTIECARGTDGYMTVMQTISAEPYIGQRVRLVARVRTQDVRGWSGLWMRVTGVDQRTLAFDDMSTRPLRGTADWREAQVLLDIEPGATSIAFGVRLADGTGQVWADGFRFEVVSPQDETLSIRLQPSLPPQPQNLRLD